MTDNIAERAAELRAMRIGHELINTDDDLVAMVDLLLELGVPLDEMVDADLTFLGSPRLIRPDAAVDPRVVFANDIDGADFRRRAALALGYNIGADARLLTPAEVQTIELFNSLRALLGDDDLLQLLRVMGSSMGKLSRSIISALRLHYETPILEETGSLVEVFRAYSNITTDMLPAFLDAAATVLRRHLAVAAAAPNLWNVDGSHAGTMEQTAIGFVDLVGFTSFTERANLGQFVAALQAFESQAQEIIVQNDGTLVKLIGDEVMFSAPTAAAAVEIARGLSMLRLGEGPESFRIGLSYGDVVALSGDFYGTEVNIAARAVQQAEPDQIVVTAAVADATPGATFESIGERTLRGISAPVELFRLV